MWRVKTVTEFKNSLFPSLIYWNDIEIHLGFQHSHLVPPPIIRQRMPVVGRLHGLSAVGMKADAM